ncbi:MAG: nucleoside phosphorylase [Candidatus Aenigmarchaeota archaeon]|nr:nucleoside phosphorylase [Candidatus Aenigmarchaeota archaeon]
MDKRYSASDIPAFGGRVYHLNIAPGQLSPDIIIVGDPERALKIQEENFDSTEARVYHRGLWTVTGRARDTGQRITVTTSGMGTPSLEIILNELVILNEIDLEARRRKDGYETMHIIRVGTSGALQPDTRLGTSVITKYAIGLDNTGLFYDASPADEYCGKLEDLVKNKIEAAIPENSRFRGKINPYVSKADADVVETLKNAAEGLDIEYEVGITASNAGFFANQGRDISRIKPTVPDIDRILAGMDTGIEGLRIANMEMESSTLLHIMGGLGYKAGAICPAIANRREETFAEDYQKNVSDASRAAMYALHALRKKI